MPKLSDNVDVKIPKEIKRNFSTLPILVTFIKTELSNRVENTLGIFSIYLLPKLIPTKKELHLLLDQIDNHSAEIIIMALVDNHLKDLINNYWDFQAVRRRLSPVNKLELLIQLKYKFGDFFSDSQTFIKALQTFNSIEKKLIFAAMTTDIPRLLCSNDDLLQLMKGLTANEKSHFLAIFKEHLMQWICSSHQFSRLMVEFTPQEQEEITQALIDSLPDLTKNARDLCFILPHIHNIAYRELILERLTSPKDLGKDQLPLITFIHASDEWTQVISYISDDDIAHLVDDLVKDNKHFNRFVKNEKDVYFLFLNLNESLQAKVFNRYQEPLVNLLFSASSASLLLKVLQPNIKLKVLEKWKEKFYSMIDSVDSLNLFLNVLKEKEAQFFLNDWSISCLSSSISIFQILKILAKYNQQSEEEGELFTVLIKPHLLLFIEQLNDFSHPEKLIDRKNTQQSDLVNSHPFIKNFNDLFFIICKCSNESHAPITKDFKIQLINVMKNAATMHRILIRLNVNLRNKVIDLLQDEMYGLIKEHIDYEIFQSGMSEAQKRSFHEHFSFSKLSNEVPISEIYLMLQNNKDNLAHIKYNIDELLNFLTRVPKKEKKFRYSQLCTYLLDTLLKNYQKKLNIYQENAIRDFIIALCTQPRNKIIINELFLQLKSKKNSYRTPFFIKTPLFSNEFIQSFIKQFPLEYQDLIRSATNHDFEIDCLDDSINGYNLSNDSKILMHSV